MALYILAIGGTGAKCVESITHLAAAGLFDKEPIRVLFIDPDESNGNLSRSIDTLRLYKSLSEKLGNHPEFSWLRSPIDYFDTWSPFGDLSNESLARFFNTEVCKFHAPELGHLFDILYTKSEQEAKLDIGFRGRPALGAAVMSQLDLDLLNQEPWSKLISDITIDIKSGNKPTIFLCGSIFGGTGASGFPTIGRLLANKFENESRQNQVKLGGLLMLPYFSFPFAPDDKSQVYANPEYFSLNTRAALDYYATQAKEVFDLIYMLGYPELAKLDEFQPGKNTQKNPSHFIEVYAALAARHFYWLDFDKQRPKKGSLALFSVHQPKIISWDDIPDIPDISDLPSIPHSAKVRDLLTKATRFSRLWKKEFSQLPEDFETAGGAKQFRQRNPWFVTFFPDNSCQKWSKLPSTDVELIKIIDSWAEQYSKWIESLQKLPESSTVDIRIEDLKPKEEDRLINKLFFLPKNSSLPKLLKQAKGIVGLARSLYYLFSLF